MCRKVAGDSLLASHLSPGDVLLSVNQCQLRGSADWLKCLTSASSAVPPSLQDALKVPQAKDSSSAGLTVKEVLSRTITETSPGTCSSLTIPSRIPSLTRCQQSP